MIFSVENACACGGALSRSGASRLSILIKVVR